MSDSQGPPDLSAFMPQANGAEGQPTDTGSQPTQPQGDSLSSDFLKNVPDADRAVVSRYVKDWDAGVTKRFQDIHDQYNPYKELGDVDKLKQAVELYDLLDNSPEVLYETLKQHFNDQQVQGQPYGQQDQQNLPAPQQQQPNPQLQQTLDPFLTPLNKRLDEQQQLMERMAQVILTGNQREQEAVEDRALDQYMAELHERHGNFDDRAILMGLYEGKDGDAAVKEWKDSLQQYIPQGQPQNVPPPLTGGSVPAEQADVGSMSDKDIRALTASVFASLQNQQ